MEQTGTNKVVLNLELNSTEALLKKSANASEQGVGNTKPKGNPLFKARKWIWTWNNYEETDIGTMEQFCKSFCQSYTFQPEVGKCGTKHLQGFWDFRNPRSFESLKKLFPKLHIEKCKNAQAAEEYCRKSDTKAGPTISNVASDIEDDFNYSKLTVWQKVLLDTIAEKPDPRKVYWIWDQTGGSGKSSLCRSLLIKDPKGTLIAGGKGNDIKCAVATHVNIHGPTALKVCLFDFERSLENKISWSGIEQIKNGAFFSGKYESSCIAYNKPHVICFSNHPPDLSKLSADRWIVHELTDDLKKIHQEELIIEDTTLPDDLQQIVNDWKENGFPSELLGDVDYDNILDTWI